MRCVVLGAGAVGGYYGAMLVRGGRDVTFVARGQSLEALRRSGLRVTGAMGDVELPRLDVTPAVPASFDLLLVCVKNYDLDEAAATLAGTDGLVLTLQNGVEAPYRLRDVVGDRVIAGTTGIVADLPEPGHVHTTSAYAWIRFGEPEGSGITERVRAVGQWLDVEGVAARAETDVRVALWEKMALMCGMAGLTTLTQRPMGEILDDPALRRSFEALVRECEAVARAAGVGLPDDFVPERMRYAVNIDPSAMSSMSRDFARGRRIELDTFNGAVVRMGAAFGVDVPENLAVYEGIRARVT